MEDRDRQVMDKIIRGSTYVSQAIIYAVVLCGVLWCIQRIKGSRVDRSKYLERYVFLVYCISVGLITRVFQFEQYSFCAGYAYNLVPFVHEEVKLLILNMLLFLPMGLLLPRIFSKIRWTFFRMFLCGILISTGIEMIQFLFLGRIADVDDIIMNTIGTLFGFLIYRMTEKYFRGIFSNFKIGNGTYSIILGIIVFIFSLTFSRVICIGDLILSNYRFPIWSGMKNEVISLEGIHYSLVVYFVMELIFLKISRSNTDEIGVTYGKKLILCFVIILGIRLILNVIKATIL